MSPLLVKIAAWIAAPTTVVAGHRYFLDIANGQPDLSPKAGYLRRWFFNVIQGAAGNKDRVKTSIPNEPAQIGQKAEQ